MVVDYQPTLDIRNSEMLPRGTGCKYLEVLKTEFCFIAYCWRRSIPKTLPYDHIIIRMS